MEFIKVSDKTLDLLTEYFDELVETAVHLDEADVSCQVIYIQNNNDFVN